MNLDFERVTSIAISIVAIMIFVVMVFTITDVLTMYIAFFGIIIMSFLLAIGITSILYNKIKKVLEGNLLKK